MKRHDLLWSSSILSPVIVLLWLLLVGAGMRSLTVYANRPGSAGQPRLQWPEQSDLSRSPDRATLVMFAHPRCPCTRASISELAVLMAQSSGTLEARVVFFRPDGVEPNWAQTDLWSAAAMIPDVEVVADEGGQAARQFGAATSGQALLYDLNGRLLFQGGITSSRGHAGDNLGRSTILRLLGNAGRPHDGGPACDETPVFGCQLFD